MSESIHQGTSLRCLRLLSGMKQEFFARKMGVKQQQISRWEKQEKIPRGKLERAAEILNIPVEVFEKFDESSLLKLASGVKLENIFPSSKEMVEYFMEELAKKDKQIEELKFALAESRMSGRIIKNRNTFYRWLIFMSMCFLFNFKNKPIYLNIG